LKIYSISLRLEYEAKVAQLKQQLAEIKIQQRDHNKLIQYQAQVSFFEFIQSLKRKNLQSENKIRALQADILAMKKQKAELMKKAKEDSKQVSFCCAYLFLFLTSSTSSSSGRRRTAERSSN
jgi:hypothetical protein